MLVPEADYERCGDVQDVVFPCGYTIGADGDTINLYYGALDSSIALAHGSIRSLCMARRQRPFRALPQPPPAASNINRQGPIFHVCL